MSRTLNERDIQQGEEGRGERGSSASSFVCRIAARPREWDGIVEGAGGSLLQSWTWGEFKRAAGWLPYRLALHGVDPSPTPSHRDPTHPLLYGSALYRPMPRLPLKVSIAYLPRGPVYLQADGQPQSGLAASAQAEGAFWSALHAESKRRGAIFLKVEPNIAVRDANHRAEIDAGMARLGFKPAGRLQPARTWVLDIGASEDDLLKGMKPKTRYNLRLAGRRGVVVRRAGSIGDLRAFYRLLEVTGARDAFGIHTWPYYEQLWTLFGPGSEGREGGMVVLLAEHPAEAERSQGPIAGLLAFRFGREAVYMYGASDNRGREHMPNYLLQWEAIRWAREHGCTLYDFWGIPDPPADGEEEGGELSPMNTRSGLRGVYWFKKGFGGRQVEYPGAYDYVYNPLLYKVWMRWRGSNLG